MKFITAFLLVLSSMHSDALVPQKSRDGASLKKMQISSSHAPFRHETPASKEASRVRHSSSAKQAVIRHADRRKRWGVDNTHEEEYWFDRRIHTLGNNGFTGAVHAAIAPLSTKLIDILAYEGVDIRKKVADELSTSLGKGKTRVVDLCCGVGLSTRALRAAFPNAEMVVGIDTSAEMIAMAYFLDHHLAVFRPVLSLLSYKVSTGYTTLKEQGQKIKKAAGSFLNVKFIKANAEDTRLPDRSFDLVTVMYAFHEAPKPGRERILAEARRLLQPGGVLAVIDISTDYEPSESMLKGEPYVLEYQKNIHNQLRSIKGFLRPQYKAVVPGHVGMWLMKRSPNAAA